MKCNLPQIHIDEDNSLEKVMHVVHNRKKAYKLKDVCLFLFYFIFLLSRKNKKNKAVKKIPVGVMKADFPFPCD